MPRVGRHILVSFSSCVAAASLFGLVAQTGCSWLYDTDQLPGYDAPIPEIPPPLADEISITGISPAELVEGYGDGEGESASRPALLVLTGAELSDDTVITITDDQGNPVPGISLVEVPRKNDVHTQLAISVIAKAGPEFAPGQIPLKVTVTKPNSLGVPITASLPWTLRGLPELDTPGQINADSNARLYSRVNVNGMISVIGTARPLVIRSTSSMKISGAFTLNATGSMGAKGGGANGGGGGAAGGGLSPGPGGSGNDGGGGGFATPGYGGPTAAPPSGDELITSFATNRGSGGGGGGLLVIVNPLGGPGGGSGGTIELSARGALVIGDVSVNGGKGTGALGGLADGGGGSGGVIVVRSGVKATVGTLRADAGLGGDTNNTNRGSVGRIRIDTPVLQSGVVSPAARRGAMFDPATPRIVSQPRLPLNVYGSPGAAFDLRYLDGADQPVTDETTLVDFQGSEMLTVPVTLNEGFNRLCTTPHNDIASVALTESTNCIDVAYIKPTPQ